MSFILGAYRFLGRKNLRLLVYPVVFLFYIFAPGIRKLSRDFLNRVSAYRGTAKTRRLDPFRHIVSFAFSMIEKIAAWSNDLDLENVVFHDDDVGALIAGLEAGQGAILLCSHIGNVELLRALATHHKTRVSRKFGVTSVVDFSGTAQFNRLIEKISPDSMLRLVNARDIGVDTVIDLQKRLAEGEILAIAGDRTASTNQGKVETLSFLGEMADFPQGAFILASIMEAPVYFMFGIREKDMDLSSPYHLRVIKAKTAFCGSRKERKAKIRSIIEEYIILLEDFCSEHPLQWYNFYDFWNASTNKKQETKQ